MNKGFVSLLGYEKEWKGLLILKEDNRAKLWENKSLLHNPLL